jgi:hypothetical protein
MGPDASQPPQILTRIKAQKASWPRRISGIGPDVNNLKTSRLALKAKPGAGFQRAIWPYAQPLAAHRWIENEKK